MCDVNKELNLVIKIIFNKYYGIFKSLLAIYPIVRW